MRYVLRFPFKNVVTAGGGHILFNTGGNSAYVWLKNPHAAKRVTQHVVNTLAHVPFGHYLTIESGKYVYHPVTREATTLDPALDAAYNYLMGTMAGPTSPDIALAFEENTITRVYKKAHGEYGAATWGAQQIPLVFAGPGVKRGVRSDFPARLIDVAPTILTLLGIKPSNMDGVVLADALVAPTDKQVQKQDALASPLVGFQRALIDRSAADIAAQKASSLD